MNGFSYISPEPMLEGKKQNMVHIERELHSLQNGKLKSGLTNKLSFYQERLDVLGKFNISLKEKIYIYVCICMIHTIKFLGIYSCLQLYVNILPLNILSENRICNYSKMST